MSKEYQGLVLAAGREKGKCMLEIIKFIDFSSITHYAGASVGSIICFLLSIGYSPDEIQDIAKDISIFSGGEDLSQSFNNMLNKFGFSDIDKFFSVLEEPIKKKFGFIPTLKEHFEKTGKYICISTVNIDRKRQTYLDHMTFPNLSCLQAVKMSSRIPFIMSRCQYLGMDYIDGGFGDPFPIKKIDDGKRKIFGLIVNGSIRKSGVEFMDHYSSVVEAILGMPTKRSCENLGDNCHIITKNIDDGLIISKEEANMFIEEGKNILKLIEKNNGDIISVKQILSKTKY